MCAYLRSVWDQTRASRFNWLWYDVTTFATYAQETSYENSLLVRQSGVLALSSMTHVMRSLTPNARAIFLLVVRYQLDNGKQQTYQGLALSRLRHRTCLSSVTTLLLLNILVCHTP